MNHIQINPLKEIVYPDKHGYTGFSICIWETDYKIPGTYRLMSPWGGAEGASELRPSKYVLEARFFVFGSLLDRVFINRNSLEEVEKISENLSLGWHPIMDALVEKEKRLWKENNRTGIYIGEMVDDDIKNSVERSSLAACAGGAIR